MIAIITGDIINSQNTDSELWLPKLKNLLGVGLQLPKTGKYIVATNFS
ncbi:hypothetical protein LDL59_06735 [Kaistella anthropi]|nr:hypothetical protein [Kaistella anthropi]